MKLLLIAVLQLFVLCLYAQENTYTSRVLDTNGQPIPYVAVYEKGTQNYATSDEDGYFELVTPSQNFTLQISSIGFTTQYVQVVDGQFPNEITLTASQEQLDEVVVTALGIEKAKQALVSAVSKVSSDELVTVPQTNLVNSLAGQVAGVQITNGSSGVGSSSRLIIRGENSLSGSNQPLFVLDGVPISNEMVSSDLFNNGPGIQEVDYGNGIAEINPDDIASMTVLKGPGSAAL